MKLLCDPLSRENTLLASCLCHIQTPPRLFPSLGFDCAPAASEQHKQSQLFATRMDTDFIRAPAANCIWKTMPLLGENMFVFPPTIDTVDNRKSRMPFYSFAFFALHVDSLHFVTVVNIDIISIPLCRRMGGM